jgi:hypothetical protein
VLEVALEMLKHRDEPIRLLGSDVLSAAVVQDPCDIRLHMVRSLTVLSECQNEGESGSLQGRGCGIMRQNDGSKELSRLSTQRTTLSRFPSLRSKPTIGEGGGLLALGFSNAGTDGVGMMIGCDALPDTGVKSPPNAEQDYSSRGVTNGSEGYRERDSGSKALGPPHGPMEADKCGTSIDETQSRAKFDRASSATRNDVQAGARPDTHPSNDMFPLLGAMMDVLCNDLDSGVFLQVLELLKSLLDVNTMRSTVEKETFLDDFCRRTMCESPLSRRRSRSKQMIAILAIYVISCRSVS